MQFRQIVTELRQIFNGVDTDLSNNICDELEHHVNSRRLLDVETAPWDSLIITVNSFLNIWLVRQARTARYDGDINRARSALATIEQESYIQYWLNDIQRLYAPVAARLYGERG